jgi:methylated-DNA-[protein]-cysteine S-methyltransferase
MLYNSLLCPFEIKISDGFINGILFINKGAREKITPSTIESSNDKKIFRLCTTQFDEYFSGKRRKFELPIRQEGTQFQKRVWDELLNIPFGKTISYLQLAQRLGDAKVIRAAASANGRNHLSIVVPCHRVIGSDGSLTGYGGGLPRKKWLLDHEAKFEYGQRTLF